MRNDTYRRPGRAGRPRGVLDTHHDPGQYPPNERRDIRLWTVTEKHRVKKSKGTESPQVYTTLHFNGEPVHTGEGEHFRRQAYAQAKEWNASGYKPDMPTNRCKADGWVPKDKDTYNREQMNFLMIPGHVKTLADLDAEG